MATVLHKILAFLTSPMTVKGPDGFQVDGSVVSVLMTLGLLAFLIVSSLVWVGQDAANRNKNPIVAVLFILLTGYPGSFIWWFWLRPPLSEEAQARRAADRVPATPPPFKGSPVGN